MAEPAAHAEMPVDAPAVTVLYLRARIQRWPPGERWRPGPLPIGGVDSYRQRLPPAVRHAVIGVEGGEPRRWHLSTPARELPALVEARVVGVEALRLVAVEGGSSILVLHVRVPARSPVWTGQTTLELACLPLARWFDRRAELRLEPQPQRSVIHHAIASPPEVAQLICAPDDPSALPELGYYPNATGGYDPYQYRMYLVTRDELEPGADNIAAGIAEVFPIGGGTARIGAFRSVAQCDFGWCDDIRARITSALLYGVTQDVTLSELRRLGTHVAPRPIHPRHAQALTTGVLAYRTEHYWTGRDIADPVSRAIAEYRRRNGIDDQEASLASFEAAAQASTAARTNLLLATIAVLGLAAAVAAGVWQGTGWKDWDALWALATFVGVVAVAFVLPGAAWLRAMLLRSTPAASVDADEHVSA